MEQKEKPLPKRFNYKTLRKYKSYFDEMLNHVLNRICWKHNYSSFSIKDLKYGPTSVSMLLTLSRIQDGKTKKETISLVLDIDEFIETNASFNNNVINRVIDNNVSYSIYNSNEEEKGFVEF